MKKNHFLGRVMNFKGTYFETLELGLTSELICGELKNLWNSEK